MKTILVTDDSKVDRTITAATLKRDFQVIEAEDGHGALDVLRETHVDLILLDVNMPGLDGPDTLREIRRLGIGTPVILLTSEVRTNIISDMMSEGIANYIVKPVSPKELSAKIHQTFGTEPEDETVTPIDVLLIDDMLPVHDKFKAILPEHINVKTADGESPALMVASEGQFDIIIVDMEIPDTNSLDLARKLKEKQSQAKVLGLFMRDIITVETDVSRMGLDGYIQKPFERAQVVSLLESCAGDDETTPLDINDNILAITAFAQSQATRATQAHRVIHAARDASRSIAAACFESVILDLNIPPPQAYLNLILGNIQTTCSNLGLELRVVGPESLSTMVEMESLQLFKDREAASFDN